MLVASLQTPRAEEVEAKQQQLGCLMSGSRQIKLNLRRAEEIRTLDFEVEFKILGFRINMILGLGGRLAAAIPSLTLSSLDKTARGGDPLLISPLLEASLVTSDMLLGII